MIAKTGREVADFNFYVPYVYENLHRIPTLELAGLRDRRLLRLRDWLEATIAEPDHPVMLRRSSECCWQSIMSWRCGLLEATVACDRCRHETTQKVPLVPVFGADAIVVIGLLAKMFEPLCRRVTHAFKGFFLFLLGKTTQQDFFEFGAVFHVLPLTSDLLAEATSRV